MSVLADTDRKYKRTVQGYPPCSMPHSDVEADASIAAAGEAEEGALSLASQDLQLVPIAAIASHRGTLRRLDLQRNRLDDPAQLSCSDSKVGGNLQALTHLNISRNDLKQLPVEIGQLQCLVELITLSHNIKLTGLPVEQATTPRLHIISVATLLSALAPRYLLLHSSPLQPFVLRCHTRTALRTAACTRLPRSVVCLGTNTHHSSTFVSVEHCGAVQMQMGTKAAAAPTQPPSLSKATQSERSTGRCNFTATGCATSAFIFFQLLGLSSADKLDGSAAVPSPSSALPVVAVLLIAGLVAFGEDLGTVYITAFTL